MITNNVEWSRIAVYNFLLQDYPSKQLVILNQDLNKSVIGGMSQDQSRNIQEIMINSKPNTLDKKRTRGELRNVILKGIPIDSLYITWNDNDWRHPTLLSTLVNFKLANTVDFVFFKNRLDYNCKTKQLSRRLNSQGQLVFLGTKNQVPFEYLELDVKEDQFVHTLHQQENTGIWDNHPQMYVHFSKLQNLPALPASPEDYTYINSFIKYYARVCPFYQQDYPIQDNTRDALFSGNKFFNPEFNGVVKN
jgi:hypothetical protein